MGKTVIINLSQVSPSKSSCGLKVISYTVDVTLLDRVKRYQSNRMHQPLTDKVGKNRFKKQMLLPSCT